MLVTNFTCKSCFFHGGCFSENALLPVTFISVLKVIVTKPCDSYRPNNRLRTKYIKHFQRLLEL